MISEKKKKTLSSVIFRCFGCFEHQKFSVEKTNIPNQNYSVRVDMLARGEHSALIYQEPTWQLQEV